MGNHVAEIVTAQVIKGLKEGRIPWRKPWAAGSTTPHNMISGHAYRGINTILANEYCIENGWAHPLFASYKQIVQAGGQVIKGSKGNLITFWKTGTRQIEDEESGAIEIKKSFMLRYYKVFNISQTDLAPEKYIKEFEYERNTDAEELLHRHHPAIIDGPHACYIPKCDTIEMPPIESFSDTNEYYLTAFHELTHWSGHTSRLGRIESLDSIAKEDESYSKEELIAEMGANMLGFESALVTTVPRNSIAYFQNWIAVLQGDMNMIMRASSKAQQAFDMLIKEGTWEKQQ